VNAPAAPPFVARFVPEWRAHQSEAFDLGANSTARTTVTLDLWGRPATVYANANLSIYSAQACNARCAFCVEELRPASRGVALDRQKTIERDDARYFAAMQTVLDALRPLNPSVSVTGGEPSQDMRLPRILRTLQAAYEQGARKRTVTSNGSGLLDVREGRPLIDWIADTGVAHLNISRAHWDDRVNAKLMRYKASPDADSLREMVVRAKKGGTRVRLSCVLLANAVGDADAVLAYLDFAARVGVDNVIFRQLMLTDAATTQENYVTKFSARRRVAMTPLLADLARRADFTFQRQVMGYYYYVEVWRHRDIDVVFEGADLAQLERTKRSMPGVIQELIFHPNAQLASTWQPWDGILGPPACDPAGRLLYAGCGTS
jgi:molybdenum cofactor biosynthesis enzyme MoaA